MPKASHDEEHENRISSEVRPLGLPCRVIGAEQARRPVAVPRVTDAPLVVDLGETVAAHEKGIAVALGHFAAAREDWAVGLELVEARPEGRRRRVLDDDAVLAAGLRL